MDWADQERIRRAIITIHVEAHYYEGLDMLCDLVGWKSFRHESGFYPSEDMSAWVRSNGGGVGRSVVEEVVAVETPEGPVATEAPSWYQRKKANFVGPVKKRGWPKGKLRGPRKPKAEVIPMVASACAK